MSVPTTRADRLALLKQIDKGPLTQGLRLLPLTLDTPRARALLLKIGLQESRLYWRDQVDAPGKDIIGPALGWLQCERGGAVRGCMRHPATVNHLRAVCKARGVAFSAQEIWLRLKTDDVLAAALGRLNLLWHSEPIPDIGNCWDSWTYYEYTWRPGKPKPETWPGFHEEVVAYMATKS